MWLWSGSRVAGVGVDVGVGLTVTEHAAQHDTHSWTYHAPAAVWFFFWFHLDLFGAVCHFLMFSVFLADAPDMGESRGMRTLLDVTQNVLHA